MKTRTKRRKHIERTHKEVQVSHVEVWLFKLEVVLGIRAEEERMRGWSRFSFRIARRIRVDVGRDGFVSFDFFVRIGDDF